MSECVLGRALSLILSRDPEEAESALGVLGEKTM